MWTDHDDGSLRSGVPARFDLTRGVPREILERTILTDLADLPAGDCARAAAIRDCVQAMQGPPAFWRGFASGALFVGGAARRSPSREMASLGNIMFFVAGHAFLAAVDSSRPWRADGPWRSCVDMDAAGLDDVPPDPAWEDWDRRAEAEGLTEEFWVGFLAAAQFYLIKSERLADAGHPGDRGAEWVAGACEWAAASRLRAAGAGGPSE